MTVSLYQFSIPVFIGSLDNLSAILTKGSDHASDKGIDDSILLGFRLYPDMLPLSFQVQSATDFVKRGAARMAGLEAPIYEDNEANFADLQSRIEKTMVFLASIPEHSVNERKDDDIVFQAGPYNLKFSG